MRMDVEKIKEDIIRKIGACAEIGLGELSHTFNEALNLIDELLEIIEEDNK